MMIISIIIIVPPARAIGRGKMLTAISTMFILLARRRRRQLASAHVCRCSLKVLRGDPNLNWTSL